MLLHKRIFAQEEKLDVLEFNFITLIHDQYPIRILKQLSVVNI